MCCCLATLRRFFKHFAPHIIGEGSSTGNSKPNSRGFSRNAAQRTFGSGGAKRTLDTLMQTNNGDSGIPLSSIDELDKGGSNTATMVKGMGKDSDSEEAILFERSVQVTYEEREDVRQNGRGVARGFEGARVNQPKVWTGNQVQHAR